MSAARAAYSVRDLMEAYSIGRSKLYEEMAAGHLISRKFGKRTLFLVEDVERWVETQPLRQCRAKRGKPA